MFFELMKIRKISHKISQNFQKSTIFHFTVFLIQKLLVVIKTK